MSTVVLGNEASVAAEIISVLSAGVIVERPQDLSMEISVPNFGGYFRLELTDLDDSEIDSGRVIVRAAIDTNATMVVTLFGESDREGFHTKSFSFGFESSEKTAESDFRLATFRAALSLAIQTRLVAPGLGLDLWFRLNEPLRNISEMLKLRQTMYRAMVIERATGRRFKIPSFISGEDMEAISFLYHAITEGVFEWPLDEALTFSYQASKEMAIFLEEAEQCSYFRHIGSQHQSLFGVEIPLGLVAIRIIDKHIEDFDQALEELRKDDGRTVAVRVRSRIGLARYNMREAPHLPTKVWDKDLQMLIDMESQLDTVLVERYNSLAASTLEGLDDEERTAITERPHLGEEAFVD